MLILLACPSQRQNVVVPLYAFPRNSDDDEYGALLEHLSGIRESMQLGTPRMGSTTIVASSEVGSDGSASGGRPAYRLLLPGSTGTAAFPTEHDSAFLEGMFLRLGNPLTSGDQGEYVQSSEEAKGRLEPTASVGVADRRERILPEPMGQRY